EPRIRERAPSNWSGHVCRQGGVKLMGARLRSAGGAAVLLVLAVCAFELGSQYLYWLESRELFWQRAPTASQVVGTAELTAKIHPYFGWMITYSPEYNERNGRLVQNLNFSQIRSYVSKISGCCDIPMRPEDHNDKYIIAVLGNSIADG